MATETHITSEDGWFTGEDKSLVFTITTTDGGSVAQDITGWALSWTLKRAATDADVDAVLTKTTAAGIALTTPASGICTVSVADTDTDGVVPRLYYHELKRTDAGSETILAYGRAELRRALHKS